MLASPGAGDVEQASFGLVDVVEFGLLGGISKTHFRPCKPACSLSDSGRLLISRTKGFKVGGCQDRRGFARLGWASTIFGAISSRSTQWSTLQKFSAVHASVHNHFNHERHLVSRDIYKARRFAALAEWQAVMG